MEATRTSSVGLANREFAHSTSLAPMQPKVQSQRQGWSRADDELRNQRTVELIGRAHDASMSAAERQQYFDMAVELNLPIAEALARRYRSRGEDLDDLIQVARLGLIQAVKRFSPEIGSFAAFAVPTISGEIRRHFRDHFWSTPRPPRRLQGLHREAIDAWSQVAQENGRIPTTAEIARHLEANEDDVRAAMVTSPFNSASLDAPTDSAAAASDRIGEPDPGFDAVDDALEHAQLCEQLRAALDELSEQDRLILRRRFEQNWKQSDIAAELGTSQMSVSRRLTKITQQLRTRLSTERC